MKKVLVTGANGQVGQCLQTIQEEHPLIAFTFASSKDLDITNPSQIEKSFKEGQFDYCINLAAYTAVDRAEDEKETAYQINAEAVKSLAEYCQQFNVILVHLSTDFVFDGLKTTPYLISDQPNPINIYGDSKLKGEQYIQACLSTYYIIRTSWVYSDFGQNFKKTMLRLAESQKQINVVNDQIGCPTHALDLVRYILSLILTEQSYGLYHFSGEKICTWYDFAVDIFKANHIEVQVNPISTGAYPTKAVRPKYSVLR
ncbi:dTDP-4-dehydrorhamnose reductase [Myroides pelagicus]|uniref:dTDP-4-dehydrorhamnose reductase n=1 Tax=Myroides pelagicus TaxID=270914 RepID=A0A7K1GKR7_9FLAO|nr:dTDP-4-dehydrorhamnose reductase [Myroides pelagicus]MEC4113249.1 dTDP-4-dehydrorhamnose reductase [Myroides pelagicus]MTH29416.1 dTDP-4-dehydrorhamnose reductase [Myroides pelagicus]